MTPTNPFASLEPPSEPWFAESKEAAEAADDAKHRRTHVQSRLLFEAECDPRLEALATHQLTEPVALAWLKERFVLGSEVDSATHSRGVSDVASDDWHNLAWLREEFASETQGGIGVAPSAVGIVFALAVRRRGLLQQFEHERYLQEVEEEYAWRRRLEAWLSEHNDWLREHGFPTLVEGTWCVVAEEGPSATLPTALDDNTFPTTNVETPR
ncbi:hypothetical protein MMAN_09570 [Mycobacterium mantenii]|uniref:Uncharacterized protein n=1 Tax=Mycobacterium mantenii TaxID=560555 RepID=A0A1X0G151_MYCNT|nr:hypothetical protein [Mycobacterium mantenii]MCV7244736.1 hypothetical protein [Mycobacterium mantenii]ORB07518.1 hypothetical protein BST30_06100 [Mycobacterium mantenii]BBY36823.1 hypothetical protein MMAN_09570 [Mycobacterium mantenii]